MPKQQPNRQDSGSSSGKKFTFVNLTDPGQADDELVRKQVRSAAAYDGWAETRKSTPVEVVKKIKKRNYTPRNSSISRISKTMNQVPFGSSLHKTELILLPSPPLSANDSQDIQAAATGAAEGSSLSSMSVLQQLHSATSPSSASDHLSLVSSPKSASPELYEAYQRREMDASLASFDNTGCYDPFCTAPVEPRPWFGWVLHHLRSVIAPRGYAVLKIPDQDIQPTLSYIDSLMMAEPALFYMCLFRSSGPLSAQGLLPPQTPLWLRGQTVSAINEALDDSRRATSDALILTVACIAAHECLYGAERDAVLGHRKAFQTMIGLVGGFKVWDAPGLLKGMVVYYDNTVAHLTGTERFFTELEGMSIPDYLMN